MYIVAMLTMLIDHAGIVFAPGEVIFRIIGRIAMPIYAYCLVQGYMHTRSRAHYMRRLVLIAAISQVPFMIALGLWDINIVATFALCLEVLCLLDRLQSRWAALGVVGVALVLLEVLPFNYGAYALLLVLAFRYLSSHWLVLAHVALNVAWLYYKGGGWIIQLYSVAPTLWIVYAPAVVQLMDRVKIKRWIWRSFYPAHLAVLAVVQIFKGVIL